MNVRELAIATHLLGMALWVGGAAAAAFVAAAGSREGEGGRGAIAAARKAFGTLANPGMALAWLAGLSYLIPNFTTFYAKAGWMHGKLTLLLVLSALTGVLGARMRKAAAGTKPGSPGLFGGLGLGVVVLAALIVFLAMLKPGA
jgi:putative membrane protein